MRCKIILFVGPRPCAPLLVSTCLGVKVRRRGVLSRSYVIDQPIDLNVPGAWYAAVL